MKTLKTILQIPLLLLIIYLGSMTTGEVFRTIQFLATHQRGYADLHWHSYAHLVLGVLEVAVLVLLYRKLEPRPAQLIPTRDGSST